MEASALCEGVSICGSAAGSTEGHSLCLLILFIGTKGNNVVNNARTYMF